VISPRKVQNVEMVRNVFHRLSGLVELRIETASGTEVEGMLSALTVADGQALIDALTAARGRGASKIDAEGKPPVAQNSSLELLWYGATSTRLGASLVAAGIGVEALTSVDPELTARAGISLGLWGMLVGVVTILAVAWLLGTAGAVVRHHGFKLETDGERLRAQEGLLTRRRVELPIHKVQVVTVSEPWLRRWFGFGSVIIETAAARAGAGGVERALSMVPFVRRADFGHVIQSALPDLDVDLAMDVLERPHPRAKTRALIRGGIQGVVLALVVSWWWWPWGVLGWLLAPAPMVLGWLDWRHQGWMISDRVVVSRRGYLSRTTRIVARDKLQSVEIDQGPLLRRYRLGGVRLRVAGSGVGMPLLDHDDAFSMAASLSETTSREMMPRGLDVGLGGMGRSVLDDHDVEKDQQAGQAQKDGEGPGIGADEQPGDDQQEPATAYRAGEVSQGADGVGDAEPDKQDASQEERLGEG
jgi:putative membrane protein